MDDFVSQGGALYSVATIFRLFFHAGKGRHIAKDDLMQYAVAITVNAPVFEIRIVRIFLSGDLVDRPQNRNYHLLSFPLPDAFHSVPHTVDGMIPTTMSARET